MTRFTARRVTVGAAALVAVSACRGSAAPGPRHREVAIEELTFVPARLEVSPGDTITWTNRDVVPHTVTGVEGRWDSSLLASGESFTLVVSDDSPGEYRCEYHPLMTGSLVAR